MFGLKFRLSFSIPANSGSSVDLIGQKLAGAMRLRPDPRFFLSRNVSAGAANRLDVRLLIEAVSIDPEGYYDRKLEEIQVITGFYRLSYHGKNN